MSENGPEPEPLHTVNVHRSTSPLIERLHHMFAEARTGPDKPTDWVISPDVAEAIVALAGTPGDVVEVLMGLPVTIEDTLPAGTVILHT